MIATTGDYELDDDPARVDRDALWDFMSTKAYWARWRTREQVLRQLDAAWRVVGVYHRDGAMVGFARAISDGVSLAYLADVYVLDEHRGHGLGKALVRAMVEESPGGERLRWLLHTDDAHGLYRQFGFAEPDHTMLERPRQS
ncbi:GNAT family N-acetyltransferase [Amycolatopsis suaedae]|uniref:N-acetyltransferase n=1 Tax=Amycolatopsis suaedae TaxID=2510978 RepID=A0A4Q7J6L0_9PSEU|nr:GNAT family N-acetyltransferase [Amycolatopsis suaedae]RZQ62476.1 N-acetyltransferase [Amycolatopsis suaedae]